MHAVVARRKFARTKNPWVPAPIIADRCSICKRFVGTFAATIIFMQPYGRSVDKSSICKQTLHHHMRPYSVSRRCTLRKYDQFLNLIYTLLICFDIQTTNKKTNITLLRVIPTMTFQNNLLTPLLSEAFVTGLLPN